MADLKYRRYRLKKNYGLSIDDVDWETKGELRRLIAAEFGVTAQTVKLLVLGHRYSAVTQGRG